MRLSLSLLCLLVLNSCSGPKGQTENDSTDSLSAATTLFSDSSAGQTGDNSQNSLDWPGNYLGVVPCADCEGIETGIQLRSDNTYTLSTRYLGKKDTTARSVNGEFSWDESGSTISLNGLNDRPNRYLVGENKLIQLDMNGERITGKLADAYVLKKINMESISATPLGGVEWKLVELMGSAVNENEGEEALNIRFDEASNKVFGYSGCNTFRGTYTKGERNQLSFSPLMTTRKACPDMKTEIEYLAALAKADNYSINGNSLILSKAKMAPLARFVTEKK